MDDDRSRQGLTLEELRELAARQLVDAPAGAGLSEAEHALIKFGLAATTTALDTDRMREDGAAALAAGASMDQLVCVMLLVAPLGMHTMHEGVRELRALAADAQPDLLGAPLDDERSRLKAEFEGDSTYWNRLDLQLPGFLDGLLRMSPNAYRRFFEFCALAWETDVLDARFKELVYLAIDATPTHRYGPGFRLHLDNATRLGASRRQVEEALDLAAHAPEHRGVRR